MLGAPAINVELEDTNIDVAIDQALRLFGHYFYSIEPRVDYDQTGDVVINLGERAQGVFGVQFMFPQSDRVVSQMNIFEIMYRMVFPRLPVGYWYELKTWYEMYQRVRGTEPDFWYDQTSHMLFCDCWSGPYDVVTGVTVALTLDTLAARQGMYWDRFLEACLAYSKQILARIRGRFGDSIPTPGGQLMSDSAVIRDEAAKTLESAELFLRSAGNVVPVVLG